MTRKDMISVNGMDRDALEDQRKEMLAKRTLEDIAFVSKNPQGRRFIWWLLEQTGVNDQSYHGPDKIHDMTFREGQRIIGIELLKALDVANPDAYIKMIGEHKRDQLKVPLPDYNDEGRS